VGVFWTQCIISHERWGMDSGDALLAGRFVVITWLCDKMLFRLLVCKTLLTLPPFTKVTASSQKVHQRRASCGADDAHVIANKAWCAKDNNGIYSSPNCFCYTGRARPCNPCAWFVSVWNECQTAEVISRYHNTIENGPTSRKNWLTFVVIRPRHGFRMTFPLPSLLHNRQFYEI